MRGRGGFNRCRGKSILLIILICFGLSYNIDNDLLRGVFLDSVSVRVIIDRDIGNLRG